ncbi:MAG: hypothetical protein AB1714_06390 [Acidobacteriota bacterium]
MRRAERGFSLVEVLISTLLLLGVLAAVGALMIPLLRRTKIEAGVAQSQMENLVGLELMRQDLMHAGHGLPWELGGINYTEATEALPSGLNDATTNPPRGLGKLDNVGFHNSDYLAAKASNVGVDEVSQKVTFIQQGDAAPHTWGTSELDFVGTDRVVQMRLVDPSTGRPMILVPSGSNPFQVYGSVAAPPATGFADEVQYIFGISGTTDPRMPFNRADYFISTNNVPTRCAAGTGVLVKAVIDHATGNRIGYYSILDCVADFQIALGVDTTATPDGSIDCLTNDLSTVLPAADLAASVIAQTLRERLLEVRVYVLSQDGDHDSLLNFDNFDVLPSTMRVGETNPTPPTGCDCTGGGTDSTLGQTYNLSAITNYQQYRWRVHRMVVNPQNLTYKMIGAAQGAK